MMLSKEIFVQVIEDVKKKCDYQSELNDFYKSHGADGYIFQPDCSESVLLLLENIFDDKDNWISYFCFELDFGQNWKEGMITSKHGDDIPLSTTEELYNLLTDNQ